MAEKAKGKKDEIVEAFKTFDKDGSGSITKDELLNVLKEVGVDATPEELTAFMQSVDADGDGNINFEEFKKLLE